MKKRRPPKDIFAESHPDADMLMLKAVIGQLIVEIGSTRERPSEWVDKFIEEVRKQLDWGQIAARERGAAETEAFDIAAAKLERRRGYWRTLAAHAEDV